MGQRPSEGWGSDPAVVDVVRIGCRRPFAHGRTETRNKTERDVPSVCDERSEVRRPRYASREVVKGRRASLPYHGSKEEGDEDGKCLLAL